jgi:hypothetical protein
MDNRLVFLPRRLKNEHYVATVVLLVHSGRQGTLRHVSQSRLVAIN